VIESEDELAFAAGVSSPDGSWISARRSTGNWNEFEWTDSEISDGVLAASSAAWGIGEPNSHDGHEDCVHIDRRGASGNLNDENCATELSFICEYTTNSRCESVEETPDREYFEVPPLSACVHEEEALANAGPLPAADRWSSDEIMCPLGPKKDSFDAICCEGCVRPSSKDDHLGLILGLTIPGGIVLLLAVCLIVRCMRQPARAPPTGAPPHQEMAAVHRKPSALG